MLDHRRHNPRDRGRQPDLRNRFGRNGAPVLSDVSMRMKTGEIVALLGRSGSGKSTLLRLIAGLTRPTQGTVKIGGELVVGPAQEVAMVFQSFALFPWLYVLDNVEIGPAPMAYRSRRPASAP